MKLTIIQTGDVPAPLQDSFPLYAEMFQRMFEATGAEFELEFVNISQGAGLPEPGSLEAILITGSAAGVYDDLDWMDPLRAFIRAGYAINLPMAGICFGHQIMADALGGDVRKSEKGWGIGRHVYEVAPDNDAVNWFGTQAAIAAAHQDQVITPPQSARVFLSSKFTPNAGLVYDNGAAISVQPHPEFASDYSKALCDLRLMRGDTPAKEVEAAKASLDQPLDNAIAARFLTDFLMKAAAARQR